MESVPIAASRAAGTSWRSRSFDILDTDDKIDLRQSAVRSDKKDGGSSSTVETAFGTIERKRFIPKDCNGAHAARRCVAASLQRQD